MKNNLKIKNSSFLIIILVILNTLILLGLNYYFSLMKFYNTMVSNNSNFYKALVILNGEYNYDDVRKNIEKNDHVISTWSNLEYDGYGKIDSIELNNLDGGIIIESLVKNNKKIIKGNQPINKNELICPSNFFPDYSFVDKYDYFNQVSIDNNLNKTIDIKYNDKLDYKFKLVGIYDNSYDYTAPNVCYTTRETLYELNLASSIQLDDTMIIVELDNIDNIDDLYPISNILSIEKMATINHSIIDNAINIITILLIVLFIVIIVSIYLIYNRSIIANLKNIGIFLIVGFTNNKIKKIYYLNSIKIGIISIIISIIINLLFGKYFILLLLHNKVSLALMRINMQYYSIIIVSIATLFCLFISSYVTLKKIDNLEINEVLYD